jgi:hypothetical protein
MVENYLPDSMYFLGLKNYEIYMLVKTFEASSHPNLCLMIDNVLLRILSSSLMGS